MKREAAGRVTLSSDMLESGLSSLAQRSGESRGREEREALCGIRTPFQRDRDRIVHSKAFRRLKHKTQVFISPEGDHYRTRLTHTLEVAGIARAAARALRLNEDLTEAVSLGHDLGHTPFGHVGEGALDGVLKEHGWSGFRHNEQSLRVVEVLEREGRGLNLTYEVRNGILHHTGPTTPETLEGQIVRICDRVAYINHDIDDALRAGLIDESDIPAEAVRVLGESGSERIDALVHDLVDTSEERGSIAQSERVRAQTDRLRAFLFDTVYVRAVEETGGDRIRGLLANLFSHFLQHPESLPQANEGPVSGQDERELVQAATDHIAGMTDRYAQKVYFRVFIPRSWVLE